MALTISGVGIEPKCGVWSKDVDLVRSRAEKEGIPVFMVASSSGCDYCATLYGNVLNSDEFKQWQSLHSENTTKPYLFLIVQASFGNWLSGQPQKIAQWMGLGTLPRVSCYWYSNGQETQNAKDNCFVGRGKNTDWYIDWFDTKFADYTYKQEKQIDESGTSTQQLLSIRTDRSKNVKTNVLHGDLEKCRRFAEENGIPLIAIWSNGDDSGNCTKIENAMMSPLFREWMKTSGCVWYFGACDDGVDSTHPSEDGKEGFQGESFYWCRMRTDKGDVNASAPYPYVRVYWKDSGGNVQTDGFVDGYQTFGIGTVTMPAGSHATTSRESYVFDTDAGTYNAGARYFIQKLTGIRYGRTLDEIDEKGDGILSKYTPKEIVYYNVRFLDWDGTVITVQTVAEGQDAIPPTNPIRTSYEFTGWNPGYQDIKADTDCIAQYTKSENSYSGSKRTIPIYDFTPENTQYRYSDTGIHTVRLSNNIISLKAQ